MTAPTLETPRLELRAIRTDDAAALHDIFTQAGVRRFLFDDHLLMRRETDRLVRSWLNQNAWVIRRRDDVRVIGMAVLTPVSAATAQYQPGLVDGIEFVIALGEPDWGWGAAIDAGQAVMTYGFDGMNLSRIVAVADLPNTRSHLLLKRLGFEPRQESDGPKYRMRGYEALRRSGT